MNAKQIISPATNAADLQLAFDVGHSSIGWAVLRTTGQTASRAENSIDILGCGAVTYRSDDCLASTRRTFRRQRRHIRSTRQRIARVKVLLKHLDALSEKELNQPGCAWPWLLASQVLSKGKSLTWVELWDVLRWYAHNRGYDGNRRWSAAEAEAQKEDSEKEANARTLMNKHGAQSMAETFCKELGVDLSGKKKSSMKRFKGLNAAFPRIVKKDGIAVGGVEWEVGKIIQAHFGKLKGADVNLEKALFTDWRSVPCPDLKLPNRFQGGLLFGQLVPRFDNRIISICPISGGKVPSRDCPEFLNFRWLR